MAGPFDQPYWDAHWQRASSDAAHEVAPNPYLAAETAGLEPGTALDAGCGEGAEALWLAAAGWRVTAADISAQVLALARDRAAGRGGAERVEWVEADLGTWQPGRRFDLVTTHYAHASLPQLELYERLARWVAPGGTLLVVAHGRGHGHGHGPAGSSHDHQHGDHEVDQRHPHEPDESTPLDEVVVTAADVVARLDPSRWRVVTAGERVRTVDDRHGSTTTLHDVVVRAARSAREA